MKRRAMVVGGLAATLSRNSLATNITLPNGATRAFIQVPQVIKQGCPEWCWAASASMIFAMHGHPIDQRAIVQRVYGAVVCNPAGAGITIAAVVNIPWTDINGVVFKPNLVAAYDFGAGVMAINNQFIVNEIASNRPLIYGNTHHAMVISQVDYINAPNGPNVLAVGVFDPWPGSPDFHPLTPPERIPQHLGGQMGFLAAVHI